MELVNVIYVDEHVTKAHVIHSKLAINGYATITSNIYAIVVSIKNNTVHLQMKWILIKT